jgi:hypothetical protein
MLPEQVTYSDIEKPAHILSLPVPWEAVRSRPRGVSESV